MEIITVAVLALVVGATGAFALVHRLQGRARPPDAIPGELSALRHDVGLLTQRLAAESSTLTARLEGIDSRMMQTQVAGQDLAGNIFDALGDVRRATTTVAEQAREFSSLQDLLKAPKARGGIGEAMLEELLRQVLPPQSYALQHRFSSGTIVDAVVHMGGRLVCIDSKFPLSNYRLMCDAGSDSERVSAERDFAADVDKHIRDIATRYVVPDEGTFDFAVMYVPAEGVYGEILRLSHRRRPLFEAAIEARVMPMSPLTMFGYLQTVLFGLKGLSIEERAEAILGFCGRLEQDLGRFAAEYDTLGKHLSNARTKYEEGTRRLDRFRSKLERVVDLADDEALTPPEAVVLDQLGDRPPLEVVND